MILGWLGFLYDLHLRMISATQEKIDKTMNLLIFCLHQWDVHVRKLACLSGSIIALHPAYGDLVYLKTKHIQMIVAECSEKSWDCHTKINKETKNEMRFWLSYLPDNNGMSILCPVASSAVLFSDASEVGCASIITLSSKHERLEIHREFSPVERVASSTYRELVAVYHGLEVAKRKLQGQALSWHTDAKNVVSIVRKGSMNPTLLDIALLIYKITKEHNITLSLTWVPREQNDDADQLS